MKFKYILCNLVILLYLILQFPVNVYAGDDVDKLSAEAIEQATSLYKYIVFCGYSKTTAAGILGNVDQESTFSQGANPDSGSYHGYFQMQTEQWNAFKSWAETNKEDYKSIVVQFKWAEAALTRDWDSTIVESPSLTDWAKTTDIVLAVEGFMVGYEKCVSRNPRQYSLKKIKLKSSYGQYYYQEGDIRIKYATQFLEKFENVSTTTHPGINNSNNSNNTTESTTENNTTDNSVSSENTDNSNIVSNNAPIIINGLAYTESELDSYTRLLETPIDESDYTSLSIDQNYTLQNWQQNIDSELEETILVVWMRRIVTILGIMFTVWMLFLYLAYWFDRVNVFFEFSLLSILSLGRLRISPDDYECTWQLSELVRSKSGGTMTVNHRAMLEIIIIGCLFGSLIISGMMFKIVRIAILWILKIIGVIS